MDPNAVLANAFGRAGLGGNSLDLLMASNFDLGVCRPYIEEDGRTYVNLFNQKSGEREPFLVNATATLRKNEWQLLDQELLDVARNRLRFIGDVRGAGLQKVIPNGFGITTFQHERLSDHQEAVTSMDGTTRGPGDVPLYELVNLPMFITHADFSYSARRIATSRNMGVSVDETTMTVAARKVTERLEDIAIGTVTLPTHDSGTVSGLTTFASRLTKTLTNPTTGGWTPATLVTEVLEMIDQSQDAFHYGPYMVYYSPSWLIYMDDDYSAAKGDNTLKERIRMIDGVMDVRQLDRLPANTLIVLQMTKEVVRMIVGMELTTLQWESMGGMQRDFKVMGIITPEFRADANGNTGLVHGSY